MKHSASQHIIMFDDTELAWFAACLAAIMVAQQQDQHRTIHSRKDRRLQVEKFAKCVKFALGSGLQLDYINLRFIWKDHLVRTAVANRLMSGYLTETRASLRTALDMAALPLNLLKELSNVAFTVVEAVLKKLMLQDPMTVGYKLGLKEPLAIDLTE